MSARASPTICEPVKRVERGLSRSRSLTASSTLPNAERQGSNVINIRFRDKSVIVINTQPPLHEIWVAAKSGGYHYRWAGTMAQPLWLDTKTGQELLSDLSQFASAQAGHPLQIGLMKP